MGSSVDSFGQSIDSSVQLVTLSGLSVGSSTDSSILSIYINSVILKIPPPEMVLIYQEISH